MSKNRTKKIKSRSVTDHRLKEQNQPRLNRAESPIAWLFSRGYLTQRQFDAGEALRRDYEFAQLDSVSTMSWSPVSYRGSYDTGMTHSEAQIAAKARFDGALEVAGRDMRDLCWRIICAGESLPNAERDMGWPVRSGKLVLRMALDRVADYYRTPGPQK